MTILAGIDIETTGLLAPEHRMVEIYVGLWDLDSKALLQDFAQRIDPERTILADAQRVHGISSADLVGSPTWEAVAPRVKDLVDRADYVVGHNGAGFDFPFIDQEFNRIGSRLESYRGIDTMLQGRWATPQGKVPNLGELCFACEVEYDPALAHAADYDVKVMMECLFKGLEWGFFKLTHS